MTLSNGKTSAYQWDIGLTVPTTDAEGTVRRFTNEHSARSIPVACAEDADGNMVYAIPNILLTTGRPIIMFTLAGDNDGIIYTDTQDYLPVFPAPKPDDYIFTDAEINLWKSLCDRMDTAEANIATNTTNIGLNTAAIAANALAIGTNANNITTLQGAMSTAQSDISAIKSAPHVYIFPFDDFTITSTATFAEVTAAFQRGDIVKVFAWGYELRLVTGQYTEPPAEEIEMTFACEIPSGDSGIFVSNAFLWAHLENGAWEFDTWLDTLPQWLDPDITDSSNYGKVPVITSDGVEWQMPGGGGGSDSVYIISLDQYDTPTNTISEIEDAIDAGKLLVAVNTESNGYGYVVMYKGEYDATSLDLYASSVDPASGVSVTAWSKQYTYTYASQTWSITASNGNQYTLPSGGTTGQALVKNSNSTGDTKWANIIPAPASPNDGDVLTYDSNDGEWVAQAPSGGSSDVYIIDLDSSYLPTCTGPDIIAAFTAGKVLLCRKQSSGAVDYYPVADTEDDGDGNCEVRLFSPLINSVTHTITVDRHTLFYDAVDEEWTHTLATETIDVDDVITKPVSPSAGNVLTWNGSAWGAANAPVTSVNGSTGAVSLTIPSTAGDVGAIPAPVSPTNGQYLMYNGSNWVAQTLPVYDGS